MALQPVLLSWTVEDAKGKKASVPVYGKFDDATATLAAILAQVDGWNTVIDNVTEAKILSSSVTIYPTLGAGLKASAGVNCDVQETGLLTFPLAGLPQKSFSVDIPAFLQIAFNLNNIWLADTNVVDLVDMLTGANTPIRVTNDLWTNYLDAPPRKAVKSFRKISGR